MTEEEENNPARSDQNAIQNGGLHGPILLAIRVLIFLKISQKTHLHLQLCHLSLLSDHERGNATPHAPSLSSFTRSVRM